MRGAILCVALFWTFGVCAAAPQSDKLARIGPSGGFDWLGWTSQGGVAVSGPDCVSAGANRIDCFARGQDGQLRRRWWDGEAWHAWSAAPGVANEAFYHSRPECVSGANDHIDCFVRRHGDGVMFRRTWDGSYVHSWENLGGSLTSDPECVSSGEPRIDCFARGRDGAMWQNAFDGNVWSGWISRGGEIDDQSKPACASRAPGKIDCLVVAASNKTLRHFAADAPGDGWKVVSNRTIGLPSAENIQASPKCRTAPDAARIDCFVPFVRKSPRQGSLARLSFDGDWSASDLASDFGRADAPADTVLAHYDFDCVMRSGGRGDCLELVAWRAKTGTPAGVDRTVRFRHLATSHGGPPAPWRNVPLIMPVEAGNVTFLSCLSVDGERIDCFTGGSWLGNATLNQASYVYQERITFRPMTPVR